MEAPGFPAKSSIYQGERKVKARRFTLTLPLPIEGEGLYTGLYGQLLFADRLLAGLRCSEEA